jgi:hypothetical protein
MAFQRIRIKNTNVAGKIPGADKLDTAELCINLKDQKLYSKDADGNVFELGKTAVNNGPTPPGSGNEIGDLWWDGDNLLVWNGSSWEIVGAVTSVNGEVGDVVLELGDLNDVAVDGVVDEQVLVYDANQGKWVPASASSLAVDVDLGYTPAPDKGTVTNTAGDDAELPLVDETNAGLMSPAEHEKLGDMPIIISGPDFDGAPSLGDIWINTGYCPPTINVWDDCDDPGNPIWRPIGGGELPGCQQGAVQIVSSNGTEIGSTLTATGGNGIDEGTALTATYEWTGAKTGSGSTIVADIEGDYTVTATITCTDGSTLSTSVTWSIADSYVDMVNNTPPVIAVVGGGVDEAYESNSIYVVTNATVLNGENPVIVENQWFKDGAADGTDALYLIGAGDEGKVITCRQLFRDSRNGELLSEVSNSITIVARPADAITFTAVITDDGTPNANKVGSVLTASATNIVGGVAPVEYGFEWKSAGATVGATKTYTLQANDVGKIIQCDVTVAEPDGTNPETRTATYTKTIEVLGTINKPTVLAPQDGAGSGVSRPIVTDTITAVDNTAGSYTCETDTILSVDDTDPANVVLELSGTKDLDCFEVDDVVQDANLTGDWSSMLTGGAFGNRAYNAFDGDLTTFHTANIPGTAAFRPIYNGTPGIPVVNQVEFQLLAFRKTYDPSFKVNDVEYGDQIGTAGSELYGPISFTVNTITSLDEASWETITTNDSIGVYAIIVDGVTLIDEAILNDTVKIVSIPDPQTDPPTITVDGGAWTGSDGTSSGDAANRETTVKGDTTNWDTTLTLAGPTDLAVLQPGDTVSMGDAADVPYQPVSDSIVRVGSTSYSTQPTSGSPFNASYTWSSCFSRPLDANGAAAVNDGTTYSVDLSATPINVKSGQKVKVYALSSTGNTSDDLFINGSTVNSLGGTVQVDVDWDGDSSFTFAYEFTFNSDTAITSCGVKNSMRFCGLEVADVLIYDGATTLTLSDKTDLAYFRRGDVVQGAVQQGLAFPTSTKGSASLMNFQNPGVDLVGNYTWTIVGDPSSPVEDPSAPAEWGLTHYQDYSNLSTYLKSNTYFNIGNGGALRMWVYSTSTDNNLALYKDLNNDNNLQWISTRYSAGAQGWPIGGSGNEEILNEGSLSVGYHVVDLRVANQLISVYVDGVLRGSPVSYSEELRFINVGGDQRSGSESVTTGLRLYGMQVIVDTDYGNEVKIVSIDDSVPSITVDGGNWSGTDGSGDATGDTVVTCVSPLKAPTDWNVERIDTDNRQLSLSHATPDDNAQVWVANDNQAGTDFNVIAARTVTDDPLLTADVRLESSLFATTPADADTLKNIVWELNGAEQNAGTSNPYTPTLSTNTTYTVRVKHQGNALEDSPWSDSTTFTTGATRNLYTYYKERVELLESRLASIEADEVNDDAADTLLITTVADLIQRVEQLEGGA